MDKVTQQTAANAEETASASAKMNTQAEQMKSFVGELSLLVGRGTNSVLPEHLSAPAGGRLAGIIPRTKQDFPPLESGGHARRMIGHKADVARPEQGIPMGDEESFKNF